MRLKLDRVAVLEPTCNQLLYAARKTPPRFSIPLLVIMFAESLACTLHKE